MPANRPRNREGFIAGYLEGFYGRLLTFAERDGLVESLAAIGARHYLYAPKEDPFHRRDWRKPYPPSWRREFRAFVARARKRGVSVVPGMAPGLSYRYRSQGDFDTLAAKILSLASLGCDEAVLLMDDIPAELPKADSRAFRGLGEAHGKLLRSLRAKLGQRIRRLWFCPTVYSDFFTHAGAESDAYLQDLGRELPPGIEVMWTGPGIVSKTLDPAGLQGVTRVLGRTPILWDNLYANDYCPAKIFLGPFLRRPSSLRQAARGLLLNPTGLYETDRFLLDLLGGFLRGTDPEATWKKIARARAIPEGFGKILPLLASPFEEIEPRSWSREAVQDLRKVLKPLIWDWKSPLQREWYPYLSQLDSDLRLLRREDLPDAAWIRKKYSPIVSRLLLENPMVQG